jgi:hypothetical protein
VLPPLVKTNLTESSRAVEYTLIVALLGNPAIVAGTLANPRAKPVTKPPEDTDTADEEGWPHVVDVQGTALPPASFALGTSVTVSPMRIPKEVGLTDTCVTAGAAVAVAVNVSGLRPVRLAVNWLVPALHPSVQLPTVATPLVFVVWLAPVNEPPPFETANVTPAPATAFP